MLALHWWFWRPLWSLCFITSPMRCWLLASARESVLDPELSGQLGVTDYKVENNDTILVPRGQEAALKGRILMAAIRRPDMPILHITTMWVAFYRSGTEQCVFDVPPGEYEQHHPDF